MITISTLCALLFFLCCNPALYANEGLKVSAVSIDEKGNKYQTLTIIREEVEEVTFFPILPYIFFDKNESDIPVGRYKKLTTAEAKYFTDKSLQKLRTLQTYRSILNIIGKRLKDNPNDKIQRIGCTDGIESITLANLRATSVKDYFTAVWSIDPNRISISERKLPEKASVTSQPEFTEQRNEENRRVELVADWKILRPIEIRDTIIHTYPPNIEFDFDYDKREQIVRSELKVWQSDRDNILINPQWTFLGKYFIWNIEEDKEHQPKAQAPVSFRLTATDNTNLPLRSNEGSIEVDQRTLSKKKTLKIPGKEIYKFQLILFDFNSNLLSDYHKQILEIIYKEGRILPSSAVTIAGYADAIGNVESNRLLSEGRAKNTSSYLYEKCSTSHSKPPAIESKGNGETDLFKDQWNTPESRMYCRTVQIEIENSINNK